jgi:hypothetical protein
VAIDPNSPRSRSRAAERSWKRGLMHQRWSVKLAFVVSFVVFVVLAVKPQFDEWAVPGEPVEFLSYTFGVLIIVSALSVYLSFGVAKLVSILVDIWFDRHNEPARVTSARLAREDAAATAAGRSPRTPFSR